MTFGFKGKSPPTTLLTNKMIQLSHFQFQAESVAPRVKRSHRNLGWKIMLARQKTGRKAGR